MTPDTGINDVLSTVLLFLFGLITLAVHESGERRRWRRQQTNKTTRP